MASVSHSNRAAGSRVIGRLAVCGVAALALGACSHARVTGDPDGELHAAMGRFASSVADAESLVLPTDRQPILDLISRYSYAWDRKDAEGWVASFKDDARLLVYRDGALRSELRSNGDRLTAAREALRSQREHGVQMRHLQTNTVLQRMSDGAVQGETMVTVLRQEKDEHAPKLHMTGTYHDRFERTPSGWKFARRELWADQK